MTKDEIDIFRTDISADHNLVQYINAFLDIKLKSQINYLSELKLNTSFRASIGIKHGEIVDNDYEYVFDKDKVKAGFTFPTMYDTDIAADTESNTGTRVQDIEIAKIQLYNKNVQKFMLSQLTSLIKLAQISPNVLTKRGIELINQQMKYDTFKRLFCECYRNKRGYQFIDYASAKNPIPLEQVILDDSLMKINPPYMAQLYVCMIEICGPQSILIE